MHRFTDYRPQVTDDERNPEPSLLDIIECFYIELDDPQKATADYIATWLELERNDKIRQLDEIRFVLKQLDELATVWGDEGVFRLCRDRLRALLIGD